MAMPFVLLGQKEAPPIFLVNPSFEDLPKCCEAPTGWYNCGKTEESPPDIQPGSFQVTKAPSNGETYLGLVVRDNDTWEAVAQRLSRPLEANQCYEFSLDLCRAELYLSLSRTTGEEVNYAVPAKVRVWGGNGYCDKREMLYETAVVTNTRWISQVFRLKPKASYTHIIIEAYFKTPTLFPYNGNILVDNASPIKQVPCTDKKPVEPPKDLPGTASTGRTGTRGGTKDLPPPTPVPPIKVDTPKTIADMDTKKLKKGDVIQLQNLYFDANKFDIKDECVPTLNDVFTFLSNNPAVVVEIGGHTNNLPTDDYANRLSANRAKAVAGWLTGRGIGAERVQYRGYGKTNPLVPNTNPESRKKNQRVEIKILSVNG